MNSLPGIIQPNDKGAEETAKFDWRSVANPPTGDRARDFKIAECLGFTFEYIPSFSVNYFVILNPSGEECGSGFWNESNPLDSRDVLHYSTDLNAAWGLLHGINAVISIKNYPDNQMAFVSFWDRVWNTGTGTPPATAICNAWLNWWDYQHNYPAESEPS